MDYPKINLPNTFQSANNLMLKAVSTEDADAFLKIITENQNHFQNFDFIAPAFKTLPEVIATISNLQSDQKNCARVSYGLWKNNSLLGLFTINKIDWATRVANVGFWLAEKYTGQGVAYFALQALINCCKDTLKLNSLTAHTATSNTRTQNLLEKSGFKKTELLKDRLQIRNKSIDDFRYVLVISEIKNAAI